MLGASRRSCGSVASVISRKTFCSIVPSSGSLSRHVSSILKRPLNSQIRSSYPSSSRLYQTATATAAIPDNGSPQTVQNPIVTRFDELAKHGLVCDTVVKTLTDKMGLETMTPVQSMTMNETLKGDDVLAQARTGTGKTLAFLIPVLQRIIAQDPSLETRPPQGRRVRGAPDVRAIIISPTRELAEQIAAEASKLTANTSVQVQTAVGGTGKRYHMSKIHDEGCHILVGTPGRLNDILSDQRGGVQAPNIDAVVLDEADRMLDVGFAPEIQNIIALLPSKNEKDHQTLMFSATVPHEVLGMVRTIMKPDYRFVQTVKAGEQQTHDRVPQKMIKVAGLENMLPSLLELMHREEGRADAASPFKALVFFNATAEAKLATAIFQNLPDYRNRKRDIIEMHSRLTQQQRTRASESFRRARSGIMFSSDVSARGMDFPNVSHVIQMGVPKEPDTYVHRLGRTARGDKQGEGWLMVTPVEQASLYQLRQMPLVADTTLQSARVDMTQDSQLPANVAKSLTEIIEAARSVETGLKFHAYKALLGFLSFIKDKRGVVEMINRRAIYGWGMEKPPTIPRPLATKLGLVNVPGVNIGESEDRFGGRPFSGGDRPRSSGRFESDRPRYGSDRSGFNSDRRFDSDRPRFGSDSRTYNRSQTGFDRSSRSGSNKGYSHGGQPSSFKPRRPLSRN